MKKFLSIFMLLQLIVNGLFAQANLSISDFKILPGETKELTVEMASDAENIIAVAAVVGLPDGLSFVPYVDRKGKEYFFELNEDRKDDHSASFNDVEGGKKFSIQSTNNSSFYETTGALFTFKVKADENATLGTYALTLKEGQIVWVDEDDKKTQINLDIISASVKIYQVFKVGVLTTEKMGSVTGAGTFESGTDITLTATPNEGYEFVKWMKGEEVVSENATYTFAVNEEATYTAVFEPKTFTLTYEIDGNKYGDAVEVAFGEALPALPAVDDKTGYSFAWGERPETMPAKDLVISGAYTVNVYKLTYMIDDAVFAEKEVAYGATLEAAQDPEAKVGHTFAWEEQPATMPAGDVTVKGTYTPIVYTLTYVINGETYGEPVGVTYGQPLPNQPSGVQEMVGYSFSWEEQPAVMPAHDVTVVGTYTIKTFTVTYVIDGEIISMVDVKYNAPLPAKDEDPSVDEMQGYDFAWGDRPATMPAYDVEIVGKYTPHVYTITYYIEDVEEPVIVPVAFGETIPGYPAVAGKYGYDKFEWTWSSEHETMPAMNLEVWGSYVPNEHRIIYTVRDENNNIMTDFSEEIPVKFGTSISLKDRPSIGEGFSFVGWNIDLEDPEVLPATMPNDDVYIYGYFIRHNYTLIFRCTVKKEDGTVETVEKIHEDVPYGASLSNYEPIDEEITGYVFKWDNMPKDGLMPACANNGDEFVITGDYVMGKVNVTFIVDGEEYSAGDQQSSEYLTLPSNPSKTGYTFQYWEDENGYRVNGNTIVPSQDVVYTAYFTVNRYYVTFKNGDDIETDRLAYGSLITLPEDTPTKTGWTFEGWYNGDVKYSSTDRVPVGGVTYEARFTINTYTVTYKSWCSETTQRVVYGEKINYADVEAAEKPGYEFIGWDISYTTMPDSDVEVYALYKITADLTEYDRDATRIEALQSAFNNAVKTIDKNYAAGKNKETEAAIQAAIDAQWNQRAAAYSNIPYNDGVYVNTVATKDINTMIQNMLKEAKEASLGVGIDGVEAELEGVQIYTIDGKRVDAPVKGQVNIFVKDGKKVKRYVK